jgi:DHA2 family multidrug resistance protein
MLSANDLFYASALLFLALVGVVWLARPAPRAPGERSAAVVAD